MTKKEKIILFLIFAIFVFLRFWQTESRNPFGWDQVDNAWQVKNMIVDHKFPLTGMVAKGNAGFYIGPAYYYLIAPFYFIFNLDPVASGVFAGMTSLVFFIALFFVAKRLFSLKLSLLVLFIYTLSNSFIRFDRVQWPVNFIPLVSLLIFYFLYKVLTKREKYLIPLGIVLGFSFHIHFTSIFYPIMIILSLPFFPVNKRLIRYGVLGLVFFLIWFFPMLISELQTKGGQVSNLENYLVTYYHGFHLTRILQLAGDAFIQFNFFENLNLWKYLSFLKFLFVPLFFLLYLFPKPSRSKIVFCYLILIWFLVPWIIFATYRGEISDYYFSSSRPLVLLIVSYCLARIWQYKNLLLQGLIILFLTYYSIVNVDNFLKTNNRGVNYYKAIVKEKIQRGEKIEFVQGDPKSYLYYLYKERTKN